ncbi:hypothetical protein L3Q82_006015 [Scortum barcoo]|uniref:Uncharacterized protein n=1 Tax=Scortum barcoo TaxID=214431 RepID=A0ACB8X353_9TELE|nr:hypothetical protein L3Q82_006015 [Scortum barcoo]
MVHRNLWLNSCSLPEEHKKELLEAPISPDGLFGPHFQEMVRGMKTLQEVEDIQRHVAWSRPSSQRSSGHWRDRHDLSALSSQAPMPCVAPGNPPAHEARALAWLAVMTTAARQKWDPLRDRLEPTEDGDWPSRRKTTSSCLYLHEKALGDERADPQQLLAISTGIPKNPLGANHLFIRWILISTHAHLPTLHSLSRRFQMLHSLSRRFQTLRRQTHHRPDHAADHPDHPNPRPEDLRPQVELPEPPRRAPAVAGSLTRRTRCRGHGLRTRGGSQHCRHSYNTRSVRAPEPKQEPETETETETGTETEESECDSELQPEASIKIAAGARN